MNAVSKAGTSRIAWRLSVPQFSLVNMVALILLILSVISAFSVIYCRDMNREMTSQLQSLQYQTAKLSLAHNQLLVEQSALSTDTRVANIAEKKLGMYAPLEKNVIMVKT